MKFTLPWPPKELSPNARVHYMALSRAKRKYRHACDWTARCQNGKKIDAERLHVSLLFVPPDRRARDLDNMIAAMKSGLDGLADVLGVDDSQWTLTAAKADEIGGFVRVEVETIDAEGARNLLRTMGTSS